MITFLEIHFLAPISELELFEGTKLLFKLKAPTLFRPDLIWA